MWTEQVGNDEPSLGGPVTSPISWRAHDAPINAIGFGRDGRRLITVSEDRTVRIWDVTRKDPSAAPEVLRGHTDAVNVAARMVALAKQRQIITTEEAVKALKPKHKNAARCIDKTTIKGKIGEFNIYEIVWERKDETVMLDVPLDSLIVESRMELQFGDHITEVDRNRPSVTMGRQRHNDVVVNDIGVSRTHARIEYRRGKFVLIDQSTNGTYVLTQGGRNIIIKRDEASLLGNGIVSLGRKVGPDSSRTKHLINFKIKTL